MQLNPNLFRMQQRVTRASKFLRCKSCMYVSLDSKACFDSPCALLCRKDMVSFIYSSVQELCNNSDISSCSKTPDVTLGNLVKALPNLLWSAGVSCRAACSTTRASLRSYWLLLSTMMLRLFSRLSSVWSGSCRQHHIKWQP